MKIRRSHRGFATLPMTIILGITFAFAVVLVTASLAGRRAGRSLEGTLAATQIAEAGVQKAIFCLNATSGTNCGGQYSTYYAGESGVDIGPGSFTTTVTGGGAYRTITSVGTTDSGATKTIIVEVTTVPPDDEITFAYALQSGEGGAHLENNAVIEGTLYTNGDVDCQSTQALVDGDVYVTKDGGVVDSCGVNYHAHADRILNSDVDGDAYYENDPADIAGTTVGGAKFFGSATPDYEPLPTMDLQFWRDSAEAGGVIYGDHSPADNSSLGPIKITGNLTLGQNVDITVTGPIWVTGNITTQNNSSFTLDPAFGASSTVILADNPGNEATSGKVTIVNNTSIGGSGDPKSHILISSTNTSTSDTSPAISVANNAAGAIFYALSGTMRLQSNGGAKSLASWRLFIDQNAVVNYVESELADLNFSNSPGGKWRILEGTWRESQ